MWWYYKKTPSIADYSVNIIFKDCSTFVFFFKYVKKKDQVYSNTQVSTQVNTSQHESTRVWYESTQINTSPTRANTSLTRVNTSPTIINTNQHESKTSLNHKKNRINMAKQNSNVTYQWCFLEKYVEGCICQWFKFFSPIYFQLYHKVLFFIKVFSL